MPPTFGIVIPIVAGLPMPLGGVGAPRAHFPYLTGTQLPWMSGYNDSPPPPPPDGVGVCGITGWCAVGVRGRGPSSSPTDHRNSLALFSHTPGASDSTMLRFHPRRWREREKRKKKNPHMIGAKSWFVTPSLPWSAPFLHLTVPAPRFPNQKTIIFNFF